MNADYFEPKEDTNESNFPIIEKSSRAETEPRYRMCDRGLRHRDGPGNGMYQFILIPDHYPCSFRGRYHRSPGERNTSTGQHSGNARKKVQMKLQCIR